MPSSTAGSNLRLYNCTAISNGATSMALSVAGGNGLICATSRRGSVVPMNRITDARRTQIGTKLESTHGDLPHRLNAAIPCGVPQVMSHSVVHSYLPPRSSDWRSKTRWTPPSGGFFIQAGHPCQLGLNSDRELSWLRRKPTNVHIRPASARCQRAANIAVPTMKASAIAHQSPANCGHTECAAGETVGAAGYVYQTLLRRQIVWPSNFLSNRDEPLGDDLRLQGTHTKGSQGFSKVTCRREGCTRTSQHIINGSLQHQHLCICAVLADQRTRQFIRKILDGGPRRLIFTLCLGHDCASKTPIKSISYEESAASLIS